VAEDCLTVLKTFQRTRLVAESELLE
jgi:hypothetical protein